MNRSVNKLSTQQGVTLVELMITIALSLSLVLGTSYIYASSRNQQQLMFATSATLDNARLGLMNMGNMLKMAGYYDQLLQGNGANRETFYPPMGKTLITTLPTGSAFLEGQYVLGEDQDQIFVRVRGYGDANVTDCSGSHIEKDHMAVMRFYLKTGNLVCTSTIVKVPFGGVLSVDLTKTKEVILLAKVDRMKVRYGVVNGDNQDLLDAAAVTAAVAWPRVTNISLSLIALTDTVIMPSDTEYSFNFFGVNALLNKDDIPIEKAHAMAFDQTVYLRNVVAGGGV